MISTFETISISSVPSDYSWDQGIPTPDGQNKISIYSKCLDPQRYNLQWGWFALSSSNTPQINWSNTGCGDQYEKKWNDVPILSGYAPFVTIQLSSAVANQNLFNVLTVRTLNFGDYYNSESNIVKIEGNQSITLSHNYIMPGLYRITLTEEDYMTVNNFKNYGCLDDYCTDWTWIGHAPQSNLYDELSCCLAPLVTAATWQDTETGGRLERKWRSKGCPEDIITPEGNYLKQYGIDGLYIQPINPTNLIYNSTWQWKNILFGNSSNALNREVTWQQTSLGSNNQLTWTTEQIACLNLDTKFAQYNVDCDGIYKVDWKTSPIECIRLFSEIEAFPDLYSTSKSYITNFYIQVLEIPPVAYLSAVQPNNSQELISPLTVRLTPRFTQCGSFPIEKIVWDLGDGSPLLTQRRWANTLDFPFVYSGALSADHKDPRNYDVIHTYKRLNNETMCFYPSITAYASSTNTKDSAAVLIGPLKYTQYSPNQYKINVLQNASIDNTKGVLLQINEDSVAINSFIP